LVKTNTYFETDVAGKSVDNSQSSRELEDLQKGRSDRTWHWFGAGLGGSDAFVSQSILFKNSLCNFLYSNVLFIPEIGERMAFYPFWSDHVAF
jgi:hypothetical protein